MLNHPASLSRDIHPLGPKVIFSYGMTKCGSTYAFELMRTALELCGFPQEVLPETCTGQTRKINFARHLDEEQVKELTYAVKHIGHPIVIKTHTRPDAAVIDMVNRGDAIIQACYRDPREIALSMLDHAKRSRIVGRAAFAEIETTSDALLNIAHQIDSFTQWLYRPNCLPLYYEDVAFSGNKTLARMLAQAQMEVQPNPIIRYVLKKRFIQLNLGVKRRYREEMEYETQRRFKRSFRPFYIRMIRQREFLPSDGSPILPEGTLLVNPKPFKRTPLPFLAQSA